VLIIGGGVIGLTVAHAALDKGLSVELVEAGPDEHNASRGNAGQVAPGHPPVPSPSVPPRALHMVLDARSPLSIPPRPSLPLLRWLIAFRRACRPRAYERSMRVLGAFGVLSRDALGRLMADLGGGAPPAAAGVADIWNSRAGEAESEAETAWMHRLGFETECLDGAALRRRDPAWGPRVRGACIHTDGLSFSPADFCDAVRADIAQRGGLIRSRFTVTTLRRDSKCWAARAASGATAAGARLVVAAGAWSPPLVASLGGVADLQAAKGYHVSVQLPAQPTIAGVLRERKIAVTPLEAAVRLAGTLELSGLNHRLVPHRMAQLTRGAADYLPEIASATPTDHWCGLRPCTANGLPIIGRLPAPQAWVATGHGMMGLTLAAGTAELILRDMLEGEAPPWAAAMRPISR